MRFKQLKNWKNYIRIKGSLHIICPNFGILIRRIEIRILTFFNMLNPDSFTTRTVPQPFLFLDTYGTFFSFLEVKYEILLSETTCF